MPDNSALTSEIKPLEWIDKRLKIVTNQILTEGKEAKWPQVREGLREMAHLVAKRGLTYNQFLALRKQIIQTLEITEPFAKTYIEQEEKSNVRTSKRYH